MTINKERIALLLLLVTIFFGVDAHKIRAFFQNAATNKPQTAPEATIRIRALTPVTPGREAKFAFELESRGKVNVVCFTLDFNPSVFKYVSSSLPKEIPSMANLSVNAEQVAKGKFGLLVDAVGAFDMGTKQVAIVVFRVSPEAQPGSYPFSFSAVPTQQGVGTIEGRMLKVDYQPANIAVTAKKKAVVGRVLGIDREGVRHARVTLKTQDGSVREYLTGSFGAFIFDDLPDGLYSIDVKSDRHQFAAKSIEVNAVFNEVDFTASS